MSSTLTPTPAAPPPTDQTGRITQIDGLRAIAALSVVAYHYTTRFDEQFSHISDLGVSISWGYLGVYLFFAISGFVIFMTLDRCRTPMDFVASRFARLFPAYWAAVALTWLTMQVVSVPGYAISLPQAVANLSMVHVFFGVPDVDGVYWSLQLELIFYVWMLAIWATGLLRYATIIGYLWVGVAFAWGLGEYVLGVHIPKSIPRFLLLEIIPWFVIGMTLYVTLRDARWRLPQIALLALCVATVALRGEPERAVAAVITIGLVACASRNLLTGLSWRPLMFFGSISYPLYLIHEKIGWGTLLWLEGRYSSAWLAVAVAFAGCVALATILHYAVEDPARRWLRAAYAAHKATNRVMTSGERARRAPPADPWFPRWTAGAVAIIALLAFGGMAVRRAQAQAADAPAIAPAPATALVAAPQS